MNSNNSHSIHEQVFDLLPWWTNNTLSDEQRLRVKKHIETCITCQEEVQFYKTLGDDMTVDAEINYAKHANVNRDFSTVLNRIDAANAVADLDNSTASAISALSQSPNKHLSNNIPTFAPGSSSLRRIVDYVRDSLLPAFSIPLAASAAAVCLAVLLGVFYSNNTEAPGNTYHVLSQSSPTDAFIKVRIQFNVAASEQDVERMISAHADEVGQSIKIEQQSDTAFMLLVPDSVDIVELSELLAGVQGEAAVLEAEMLPNSGR